MSHPLPPQTTVGVVSLTVADLDRSLAYYQQGIGLKLQRRENGTAVLGAGPSDLLALREQPGARPLHNGHTGLYHFAILVPSRLELARTLQHLAASRTPISGFADHAVSEAIYLTDPDGHGIEIYRDRPRHEWEYPSGRLKLTTEPFDMEGVLGELQGDTAEWAGLHPDTVMGHIHLQVADTAASERFYIDVLGFDLMARYGASASFISAGGYHHHLGMNTWHSAGAPPQPPDAARLLWYEIRLPDTDTLTTLVNRLQTAGVTVTEQENGFYLQDPSQNGILLVNRET